MKKPIIKFLSATLVAVMFAGLFTGCSGSASLKEKETPTKASAVFGDVENRVVDVDYDLNGEAKTSLSDFGINVLKKSYDGKNEMISPLSILVALNMAANGSNGITESEFEEMYGISIEDMNAYLYLLSETVENRENSVLSSANAIWVNSDKKIELNSDYLQVISDYYKSNLYYESFGNEALGNINNFVKENTDGMIPSILSELLPDDIMVLVNALSFDAEWEDKFDAEETKDKTFHNLDGSDSVVSMMSGETNEYIETSNGYGFMKNYVGGYKFVAILPNEDVDFDDFVDGLSGEYFLDAVSNPTIVDTDINMPRFTSEYDVELAEILIDMGIPTAFGPGADFSGITDSADIYIDRVIHKTFIEVGEEGTKAAAATAVVIAEKCAEIEMNDRKVVNLNRPFVYAIVDAETSAPVFIGMITEQ